MKKTIILAIIFLALSGITQAAGPDPVYTDVYHTAEEIRGGTFTGDVDYVFPYRADSDLIVDSRLFVENQMLSTWGTIYANSNFNVMNDLTVDGDLSSNTGALVRSTGWTGSYPTIPGIYSKEANQNMYFVTNNGHFYFCPLGTNTCGGNEVAMSIGALSIESIIMNRGLTVNGNTIINGDFSTSHFSFQNYTGSPGVSSMNCRDCDKLVIKKSASLQPIPEVEINANELKLSFSNVPSNRVLCLKADKTLGYCTDINTVTGGCTCN